MPKISDIARLAPLALLAGVIVLPGGPARSTVLSPGETQIQPESPGPASQPSSAFLPQSNQHLLDADRPTFPPIIQRGLWSRACSIATNTLAQQEPDEDALGIFAICSAVTNNKAAADSALWRLRQTEAFPYYYASLAQGILESRNGSPDEADKVFRSLLQARPDDPLVLYFSGAVLQAQHKDAEAILTYRKVLKAWPDYAPALVAAAQLMATPDASEKTLNEAIAMTERATAIEPTNRAYWKQLAELYDQSGQHDRASAVRLQWLSVPRIK
jgi:tetratricopeptide (TPR) repeat protein